MKKKTFLVTGGSGFIGSHISELLLKSNYNVIVYDNNFRNKNLAFLNKYQNCKFIKGDIRNKNKLFSATKKVDAIIHLAYINGTKYFYSKPDLVIDVAIRGLINVFEVCLKKKIKEFYLASSSEVYQTPLKIPTKEDECLKVPDIFNPRYSYGGGKIISEITAANYGKKYFKKMIIFRPHNVYGPNMGNEHVIPELINKFKRLKQGKIQIQGSGKEIRSFIYIDDFVRAIDLILKKGKHLNIYNIGTSEKITIKRLVKVISRLTGKNAQIIKSPLKKGGTKIRVPNILKIKKLGFKRKISLEDGIRKLLFKNN
jgi:nucleoside-diphosphate-sugar epimerase